MYGTWIVFSRQLLRVMLLLTMIGSSASAQRYFDAPFRSFDATNREWAQEGLTCVAAADMNGDGLPDAVAGQLGIAPPGFPPGIDGVYVYLNQGSVDGAPATFSAPVRYPVLYDPLDVALADIDADGDLDVVLACFFNDIGAFGGNIAILRNNGDGSLQTATYLDTGIHGAHGVCAGDLDGDGDVDLAVTNHGRSGTTISVFANLGNGAFAPRITYETGAADPNGIAAADLDNDGDLDLAVAHDEPARVSILFNDGTGVFGEPSGYPGIFPEVNDGEYGSLVVFDADLDGDSDIAYTSTFAYDEYEDDGKIAILRNNGNGVFSVDLYPYLLPFRDAAVDLAAADLDGDGFVDLLGAEFEEPGLISFINDGTGGFLGARVIPSAGDAFAVAVADLDLDGDPDGLDINR
ncbi:MAG: VCBS repeat-containing protein, partial [Candidatus Eisenbacteria bacterium]|nr:VCBS repeat-containing protein [Candidatus Eisenbacteria bacterium]